MVLVHMSLSEIVGFGALALLIGGFILLYAYETISDKIKSWFRKQ